MNTTSDKAPRGRPKTLNRDHVLDVAMYSYWKEGIDGISLNEICRNCEVSKPGIYREFGSEDDLKKAVLLKYQEKVQTPVLQLLKNDAPFRETLNKLVSLVTSVNDNKEAPRGCLIVKTRESKMRLGKATRKQIDLTQKRALRAYEKWVESAKAKGELSVDVSSQFAAIYIDAQLSYALSQIARGENRGDVKRILNMAFSMFDK